MAKSRKKHEIDFSAGTLEQQAIRALADGLRRPVETPDPEVDKARTNFLAFIQYTFPGYVVNWHHRVVAERLERWAEGKGQRLILIEPSRHGKPLWIGSLVLMANGLRKRLADVSADDMVITHDGTGRKVLAVHEQGVLDCVEIKTASGRTVRSALTHPFLTPDGWKNAGELKPGDVLANVPRPAISHRWEFSPEACRLMGYFVGDGNCTARPVEYRTPAINARITADDPAVVVDIESCCKAMGFEFSVKQSKSAAKDILLRGGVREWLRKAGIAGQDSATKRVPRWLFTASPVAISHFLGAYFACDGCVFSSPKQIYPTLEIYSINRPLLEDCQHLFLRLGIQTAIQAKKGKYQGERHLSWRLKAATLFDSARFIRSVHVVGRKADKIARYTAPSPGFAADYLGDPVVSVIAVGGLPCRCLTIAGNETFTANDFVVHNTEQVSRRLPAYILGRNPDAEFIAASYGASLAADNNRDVQGIIDSDRYAKLFPNTKLFSANVRTTARGSWLRNSDVFQVVGHRGVYRCAGIGGPLAGKGAQYLVLDDPHKDYQDACSPAMRKAAWNWFTGVFYQRANTGGANILITATRWMESDLIGMLLDLAKKQPDAEQWEVMRFPIEGEDPDPAEPRPWDPRKKGEPLDRRVRDEKAIAIIKATTPPNQYAAMYVGKPTDNKGNIVKRDFFRYFGIEQAEEIVPAKKMGDPPTKRTVETYVLEDVFPTGETRNRRFRREDCRLFQVCDTAQTIEQASDFTVILTAALTPEFDLLFLDVDRDKLEIPHQYGRLKAARARWPGLLFQAVEKKVSGIGLIQQAALDGIPFKVLLADGDKAFRAAEVTAMYNAHKVFHRTGAAWLVEFEDELLAFPNGAHDDQWDAAAYAGRLVRHDQLLRLSLRDGLLLYPETPEDYKPDLANPENLVKIDGHEIYMPDDDEKPWYER